MKNDDVMHETFDFSWSLLIMGKFTLDIATENRSYGIPILYRDAISKDQSLRVPGLNCVIYIDHDNGLVFHIAR